MAEGSTSECGIQKSVKEPGVDAQVEVLSHFPSVLAGNEM